MSEAKPSKPRPGLISVEDTIDEIARKALEEARRREEAETLRKKHAKDSATSPNS